MRRGRIWWIQFREEGRRVRESLKTTNRKVAEDLRLRRQLELGQKRLGLVPAGLVPASSALPAGGPVTPDVLAVPVGAARPAAATDPAGKPLAEVRAEYVAWSKAHKRAKTIRNDCSRLDAFFATVPGVALPAVRTADVERYLTSLAGGGRSPATLMRNREILHAFWRWALRQGYVTENVVAAIPRPRIPERDPVFLSLAQVDELLAAVAGTAVEGPVATAVFAGLRREELCWLTWADLELDRQPAILRVRSKVVDGEAWQPKTKRDRKVPVSPRLLAVLQRIERRRGVPWLLASPEGCRWDPDNLGRAFRAVTQAAGLPWNLLQLRHTFGSQLARKGVSLLKIARLMGNSPLIASKHYINLVPEEMVDEVAF